MFFKWNNCIVTMLSIQTNNLSMIYISMWLYIIYFYSIYCRFYAKKMNFNSVKVLEILLNFFYCLWLTDFHKNSQLFLFLKKITTIFLRSIISIFDDIILVNSSTFSPQIIVFKKWNPSTKFLIFFLNVFIIDIDLVFISQITEYSYNVVFIHSLKNQFMQLDHIKFIILFRNRIIDLHI